MARLRSFGFPKTILAITALVFLSFCIININGAEVRPTNESPMEGNPFSIELGTYCSPTNVDKDGKLLLRAEPFPKLETLEEPFHSNWTTFCFGRCIFKIGDCEPIGKFEIPESGDSVELGVCSTILQRYDLEGLPTECRLPLDLTKNGNTSEIAFSTESNNTASSPVENTTSHPPKTKKYGSISIFLFVLAGLMCFSGVVLFIVALRTGRRPVRRYVSRSAEHAIRIGNAPV